MTISMKFGIVLVAGAAVLLGPELGERDSVPVIGSFVSTAEAVVGRPLTPVSVAGVARRSSRDCRRGDDC